MPKYLAVCFSESYITQLYDDPTQALTEFEYEYGSLEDVDKVNLFKIEGEVPFKAEKTFVFSTTKKL